MQSVAPGAIINGKLNFENTQTDQTGDILESCKP